MGEFPTERETWKATRMINTIKDDFPKVADEMVGAFKESESMNEFKSRAATYLWYDARNAFAIAVKMGLIDEVIESIVDSFDEDSFSGKESGLINFFLIKLMSLAKGQVF